METLTCPKCQGAMRSYERSGVTIDQCGDCRGIFLDRGELERLIDADTRFHAESVPAAPPPPPEREYEREYERSYDSRDDRRHGKPYKKKKRSIFEDLFD